MRVLTFLNTVEPGGAGRVAFRLVRQWRSRGIDAPLSIGRASGALRAGVATDLVEAAGGRHFAEIEGSTVWSEVGVRAIATRATA